MDAAARQCHRVFFPSRCQFDVSMLQLVLRNQSERSDICVVMTTCKPAVFLCFDPRDPLQSVDDRSTWRPTPNAILISATMLLAEPGGPHSVSWDKVAALASLCEAPDPVADRWRGFAKREDTDAMLEAVLVRSA